MSDTVHIRIATKQASFMSVWPDGMVDAKGADVGGKRFRLARREGGRTKVHTVSREQYEWLQSRPGSKGLFETAAPDTGPSPEAKKRAEKLVDRMAGWSDEMMGRFEHLAAVVEGGGAIPAAPPSAPAPAIEKANIEPDDEPDDDKPAKGSGRKKPAAQKGPAKKSGAPGGTLADLKK